LNVEVVRVEVLNDTGEEGFGNSSHSDDTLLLHYSLLELVLAGKHALEVIAPGGEDETVSFDKAAFNEEHDVVEFVKVLALVHVRESLGVESFVLVFSGLH